VAENGSYAIYALRAFRSASACFDHHVCPQIPHGTSARPLGSIRPVATTSMTKPGTMRKARAHFGQFRVAGRRLPPRRPTAILPRFVIARIATFGLGPRVEFAARRMVDTPLARGRCEVALDRVDERARPSVLGRHAGTTLSLLRFRRRAGLGLCCRLRLGRSR
jgi:hypothetical protein